MVETALILAFCLMFILASGALVTTYLGILELRKLGTSAFVHLKSNNIHEATKAQIDLKQAEATIVAVKGEPKIPVARKKTVKTLDGKTFSLDELEAL